MSYIETDLDGINSLVGGLPTRQQLLIYGAPSCGKSILTHQLAHIAINQRGGNALILDTEGSIVTHNSWVDRFNERYDQDVDLIEVYPERGSLEPSFPDLGGDGNLVVYNVSSFPRILRLFGRPIDVSHTGKKLDAKVQDGYVVDAGDVPLAKWAVENNVHYLGQDSVTMPAEVFGTSQQNLPARHACLMNWMQAGAAVTQFLNLTTVSTLHESVSPTNQFERVHFSGGKAVGHNHKTWLYLVHKSENDAHTPSPPVKFKRENDNGRYVWLGRHPSKPPWQQCVLLDLCSEGFVDYER